MVDLTSGIDTQKVLENACRVGAFVASRNGATPAFVIAVVGNLAAKVFELLDKPIYGLGGIVSGHTLKHLSAGLAFLPLVFLIRRIGKERMVDDSMRPDLAAAGFER